MTRRWHLLTTAALALSAAACQLISGGADLSIAGSGGTGNNAGAGGVGADGGGGAGGDASGGGGIGGLGGTGGMYPEACSKTSGDFEMSHFSAVGVQVPSDVVPTMDGCRFAGHYHQPFLGMPAPSLFRAPFAVNLTERMPWPAEWPELGAANGAFHAQVGDEFRLLRCG